MSKAKKQKIIPNDVDVEELDRSSFTPGWSKLLAQHEGLPIKRGGKIVRVRKDDRVVDEQSESEEDDGEDDQSDNDESPSLTSKPAAQTDSEFVTDDTVDVTVENLDKERTVSSKSQSEMTFGSKSSQSLHKIQQKLADICTAITANPERSLRRKVEVLESGERVFRMTDLFELLGSDDVQVFEMAMLSALLVFKDICPGYRIRPQAESDTGVTLKKETRALRDFELSLLAAYKKYLVVLDEKVQAGLGNARKEIVRWGVRQKLGLSALRCMCELVRSLSHFNFKSLLLAVLVTRGAQPCAEISNLCCDTLTHVFATDKQGETSFEVVRLIAKVLVTNKYSVPDAIVHCLRRCKLAVHADESKNVHRRAKRERRKRKKEDGDEAALGMLESKATMDDTARQRFQADALTEVQLIYFRIIKTKVGFGLLPAALEGLGGITHLINMETVEDLVALMRGVLEGLPPAPELIQLLCIHCALRTLSGPGQELKIDEEVYLMHLRGLIRDLPVDFARWDLVLECLDLSFLQKREERNHVVVSFVKLLFLVAVHMTVSGATAVLAMAHAILLRYPRARQALTALVSPAALLNMQSLADEEEQVCDLAMRALKEASDSRGLGAEAGADDLDGDGSWSLVLLRLHMDRRYRHVATALTSKDLLPMPMRVGEARYNPQTRIAQRLESVFASLPSSLRALNSMQQKQSGADGPAADSKPDRPNSYTGAKRPKEHKRGFGPKRTKTGAAEGQEQPSNGHSAGRGQPHGGKPTIGSTGSNGAGKVNSKAGGGAKVSFASDVKQSPAPPATGGGGKANKPKFGKNRK